MYLYRRAEGSMFPVRVRRADPSPVSHLSLWLILPKFGKRDLLGVEEGVDESI